MSERRQAAWDEAQRRYPTGDRQAGFVAGAAWADDNPQPRAITRSAFTRLDLVMRIHGIRAMLNDLGFKVVDDE